MQERELERERETEWVDYESFDPRIYDLNPKQDNKTLPSIEKLGDVKELFLNEKNEVDLQSPDVQKILKGIFGILEDLYILNREGTTRLEVPSSRIAEAGKISMEGRENINIREARRKRKKIETADKNTVIIKKNNSGFMVYQRYIKEVKKTVIRDIIVESKNYLSRKDGNYQLDVEYRQIEPHLYYKGELWDPRGYILPPYGKIPPTASGINNTLILLVEGLSPGYIK